MLPSHRAKRLFDRHRPVYARRLLVEGERTFQPGDHFPWEELGLRPEHVLMLYRHRHVDHDQLVDAPPAEPGLPAPDAQPLTDALGNRIQEPDEPSASPELPPDRNPEPGETIHLEALTEGQALARESTEPQAEPLPEPPPAPAEPEPSQPTRSRPARRR